MNSENKRVFRSYIVSDAVIKTIEEYTIFDDPTNFSKTPYEVSSVVRIVPKQTFVDVNETTDYKYTVYGQEIKLDENFRYYHLPFTVISLKTDNTDNFLLNCAFIDYTTSWAMYHSNIIGYITTDSGNRYDVSLFNGKLNVDKVSSYILNFSKTLFDLTTESTHSAISLEIGGLNGWDIILTSLKSGNIFVINSDNNSNPLSIIYNDADNTIEMEAYVNDLFTSIKILRDENNKFKVVDKEQTLITVTGIENSITGLQTQVEELVANDLKQQNDIENFKMDVEQDLQDFEKTITDRYDELKDQIITELIRVNIHETLIGSIIMMPHIDKNIDSTSYKLMNGTVLENVTKDYTGFLKWVKDNAPEWYNLVNNTITLPDWTARFPRMYGSITLNTTINGTTVPTTYNAGVPGTFSFDAMQRLTGTFNDNNAVGIGNPATSGSFFKGSGPLGYRFQPENTVGYGFTVGFDNAKQARTDTENRPLGVSTVYYIKVKNNHKGIDLFIAEPQKDTQYHPNDSIIRYKGQVYTCVKDTIFDGVDLEEGCWELLYKSVYTNVVDSPVIGQVSMIASDLGGEGLLREKTKYARKDYPGLYFKLQKERPDLIIDADNFMTPSLDPTKPEWNPYTTFYKNDEVVVSPSTYDTITIPNDSEPNHMGRYVYYNSTSYCKRFDVRLRAKVDNPGNPLTNTAKWEVVIYNQLIEWGSNTYGEYWLYANGDMKCKCKVTANGTYKYPITSTIIQQYTNGIGYDNASNLGGIMYQHSSVYDFYITSSTTSTFVYARNNTLPAMAYLTFEGKWYNI